MNAVVEGLKRLGPVRLGAMAAVAVGVLALLAFLALRGGGAPMALLYSDLDLREAGQVTDELDRARIPKQVEAGGSRILVPQDQVARARLLLAKGGLPSGGAYGARETGPTARSERASASRSRTLGKRPPPVSGPAPCPPSPGGRERPRG